MSDFTARLGMLRGSMPTVARGGRRGVRFRLGEMVELTRHRDQTERLMAKATTDDQRTRIRGVVQEQPSVTKR